MFIRLFLLLRLLLACPDSKFCRQCLLFLDQTTKCQQCEASVYNLQTKLCDPIKLIIPNCKIYALGETISCELCDYGYALSDSKCSSCEVKDCAFCSSDRKVCNGCFGRMNLVQNQCLLGTKCPVENCEICGDKENTCLKCQSHYALFNAACLKATPNCYQLSANDQSKCDVCDFGHYITKSFTC